MGGGSVWVLGMAWLGRIHQDPIELSKKSKELHSSLAYAVLTFSKVPVFENPPLGSFAFSVFS